MKRLIITLLLSSGVLQAQGVRKDITVLRDNGRPASGATIRVCPDSNSGTVPCTPTATVYSNQSLGTVKTNPVVADGLGNAWFYAPAGEYRLEIGGPGVAAVRVYDNTPLVGVGAGSGSVTSVAVSLGSDWTCSPVVTTSGTITCTLTGTPTGTNVYVKSDSPIFSTKIFTPMIENGEVAAPGNPAASTWRLYPKNGGVGWCEKNSAGNEYCMSQNASPLTAKGQLFGYTGSVAGAVPAPLVDGYILTADSTQATGVGWQAPGGGGGSSAPFPYKCLVNGSITFSNSATQHTMHTCDFAAGETNSLNRVYRLKNQGYVSTCASTCTPTLNLTVTVNGVTTLQQWTFTLVAGLASAGYTIDCDIMRTVIGSSGATASYCTFEVGGLSANTVQRASVGTSSGNGSTWDATVAQSIVVKETFSVADPGNSITSRYLRVTQENN